MDLHSDETIKGVTVVESIFERKMNIGTNADLLVISGVGAFAGDPESCFWVIAVAMRSVHALSFRQFVGGIRYVKIRRKRLFETAYVFALQIKLSNRKLFQIH